MAQRKPTKAELEYGRLRSTAAGLPSTTTKKQLKGTSKRIVAAAVVAANATPTGRAASTVAKFASASKSTKLASGASKIKTRTFTQGSRARVTNTPPIDIVPLVEGKTKTVLTATEGASMVTEPEVAPARTIFPLIEQPICLLLE